MTKFYKVKFPKDETLAYALDGRNLRVSDLVKEASNTAGIKASSPRTRDGVTSIDIRCTTDSASAAFKLLYMQYLDRYIV